jgi:hypothetical protein
MELYKELAATREILKDTYDDLRGAEDKAIEIQVKIREFLSADEVASTQAGEAVYEARNVAIRDLEKFFSEPMEPTVPEPFYALLAGTFIHTKVYGPKLPITAATKDAIRLFLFYGMVDSIINSLRSADFQAWLFELNVSEKDDFNTWLANLLVEVSHEVQDKRFNRVASYIIDVLHIEAQREDEAVGGGLYLWHFNVAHKPGGKTSKLEFTTRGCELDGQRISGSMISEVQFGTESHTTHSGFVSNEHMYSTITLFLEDGSQYTRYQFMGTSEQQINDNRISSQRGMEKLAGIFEVTNGGHGFSSSGYRTSYSIGYWF